MEQLVSSLTAVIALVASAIGALVAVDQITLGARTRRKAAFLRETIAAENDDSTPQRDVLVSLYRTTMARFVAQDAIGGWRFAASLLGTAAGLLLGVLSGAVVATGVLLTHPGMGWVALALVLVPAAAALATGTFYLLLAVRRRTELARDFLAGNLPLIRDPGLNSKTLSKPERQAQLLAVGVSAAFLVITAGVGMSITTPGQDQVYSDLGAPLAFLGLLLFSPLRTPVQRFTMADAITQWKHPQATLTQAPTAVDEPAQPPTDPGDRN